MASKQKFRMNHKKDFELLDAASEQFRIKIDKVFQKFMSNDSLTDYTFPSDLTTLERKYVHQKAHKSNLLSRSHGKDDNRTLSIYKKRSKTNFESFFIDITPKSQDCINQLLKKCTSNSIEPGHRKVENGVSGMMSKFLLGLPPPVIPILVPPHIEIFQMRLPIFELKDKVIEVIRNNSVVIISSETGSGKTTQIPQYIVDDCRTRNENCRVLCTQPRRISAVSVAERVAEERGSTVGRSVGYQVRLETRLGPNTNLIYCTNGVLVRNLMMGNAVLTSITHVIIDEIHERDKLSDFLLICLKESLAAGYKIKVILMSATIHMDKFVKYFQDAAVLEIPGRMYSIKELFLDEILELTGYDRVLKSRMDFFGDSSENINTLPDYEQNESFDQVLTYCLNSTDFDNEQAWCQLLHYLLNVDMPVNYQHSVYKMTALMIAVNQKKIVMVEKLCTMGADVATIKNSAGLTALDYAESIGDDEVLLILNMIKASNTTNSKGLLDQYYKTMTDEDIDYELLKTLLVYVHHEYKPGAILVFLPGYDDIMLCHDYILESPMDKNTYKVYFLHSSMNIKEQHDVFKPLPNKRKIILSTNIAETSVTINDVVYVIDSGKAKVLTYDSCSGLSSLQTEWISKACVKQRTGRAGRTNAGLVFHLYSKARYDAFMEERVPEMLRVPLEELCLNTKALAKHHSIYDFLVKALDPPFPNTVKTAIENLESLGALDDKENLTPLGEYLSQLTIEPHLGKMLVYATIFKCLDPILTIVASLAQRDPYQLPPQANLRTLAAERRKELSEDTLSDHFIYLRTFINWQNATQARRERQFCRDYFISSSRMETILKTRSQLLRQLKEIKFVTNYANAMTELNKSSENWPLIKAVISSGLYPKVSFKNGRHFSTRTEKKVFVNNSSSLCKESVHLWIVYDELVKVRSGSQMRGVTPVTPITISLMCGIKTTTTQNHLCVDDWMEFEFPNTTIIKLRKLIDNLIARRLSSPNVGPTLIDGSVLHTLTRILVEEELAAEMPLPAGNKLKQRPRFLEFNRVDNQREDPLMQILDNSQYTHSDQIDYQYPNTSASSNAYYSQKPFSQSSVNNYSPLHETNSNASFGRSQSNTTFYRTSAGTVKKTGYVNRNNFNKSNHTYNYQRRFNVQPNNSSHMGNAYGNNNVNYGNKLTNNNPSEMQSISRPMRFNINNTGSTELRSNSICDSQQELAHSSNNNQGTLSQSMFFLIKAKKESNLLVSYEDNCWVFAPSTEKKLAAKNNDGCNVFLIYTVSEMNCFYGIAKFLSLDRSRGRPRGRLHWIFKQILPFKEVRHLRNPINGNKLIYDADDGQEIHHSTAESLWDLFSNQV